jgi:hypothetical protein
MIGKDVADDGVSEMLCDCNVFLKSEGTKSEIASLRAEGITVRFGLFLRVNVAST